MLRELTQSPNFSQTAPTLVEYDDKAGLLSLKWISIAACSTTSKAPPPPPGGNDQDKEDPSKGDQGKKPPVEEGKGFFGWFFTLWVVLDLGRRSAQR